MARKPRVEFPGGLYHVISRGNNRRPIFRDDVDRKRLLELLTKYKKQHGFKLFAFVFMSNHIHLLMETGAVPLSKTMQQLLGSYTRYFNRRHHRVGHLFQGRYRALLCEKEPYLLELVRYIHLNPVRSRLVKDPAAYHWSGHKAYLGKQEQELVDAMPILRMMGKGAAEARRSYLDFVLDGLPQGHREDFYQTREQRFLGSEGFVEEIQSKVGGSKGEKGSRRGAVGLKAILMAVSDALGISPHQILSDSQGREVSRARGLVAYLARKTGNQAGKSVADFLNRDPSVVVRMVERIQDKIHDEGHLRKLVDLLANHLSDKA